VARLRALQERARDEQADRDALRARRAQEQAERDWRRKEAEEARRHAETEAMLIEAREQQMKQKEHFLSVQAQRERADFERVLRYDVIRSMFTAIAFAFTAYSELYYRAILLSQLSVRRSLESGSNRVPQRT